MNDGVSRLPQVLMADFLASGQFMRHLRRTLTHYRARRARLLGELQHNFGDVRVSQGGRDARGLAASRSLPDGL